MLKPAVGQPWAGAAFRRFWLIFAALDAAAILGLLGYNRFFALDTPEANLRARRIMIGAYALLAVLGLGFLIRAGFSAAAANAKTLVQAAIMAGIGLGGTLASLRKAPAISRS
jgi:hypothetical protein